MICLIIICLKMEIQIVFFLVCLLCIISRGKVKNEEKEGLVYFETKDYTETKVHIKALKKLLLELENTRNKTQTCKFVFLQLKIYEETDLGITRSLISKFKKVWKNQGTTSCEEMLLILTCLEHFMNDFNNAHEFEKLNGIQDILFPALDSTLPFLKAEAAHLLASAALHSPHVQITALESGVIAILLKTIVMDFDIVVRINSMNAVICILKNFPEAQAKFVNVGGLKVLAQVVETPFENHQLLIKIVGMMHELVEEHKKTIKSYTKNDVQVTNLYKAIGLEEAILKEGWCLRIAQLLVAPGGHIGNFTHQEDGVFHSGLKVPVRHELNLVEKVCETLVALVDICHHEFNNIQLETVSRVLNNMFYELIIQGHEYKYHVNETVKSNYSRITEFLALLTRELDKFSKRDEL